MRPSLFALFFAAAALAGCGNLRQMLETPSAAQAPTVNVNIAQNANRGAGSQEDIDGRSGQEANGDVGASSSGALTATQTTTVQVDPDAVGRAIGEGFKTFTAPAATTLLDAAQGELAGGDPDTAARLLKRAQAAEKAAKDEAAAKAKAAAEAAAKSPPADPQ